jgi:ubiquinone/menaquinone biosynthesis C-methylase UbiE
MRLTERTGHGSTLYEDATRYDRLTAALSGAGPVEFYRKLAQQWGDPVLELACGTGRIAIPLAQSGAFVVGLDQSRDMLRLARRKTRQASCDVAWVNADMRRFSINRRFALIFIATNSFPHLLSRPDIEACLASVRKHLWPSGRFVVDVFNPSLDLLDRDPTQRFPVTAYNDPETGGRVVVTKMTEYDRATQVIHEVWYCLDELSGREDQVTLNLRVLYPQELDSLLHYNGFQIDQKYGDYEGGPFAGSSNKQIVVCRIRRRA